MYIYEGKIIRDLVHDYFNLTPFELELIDTIPFQRLKDIRQLTCQHVYPNARHTRFEHSLGVLELTKRVIRYINKNGFIDDSTTNTDIISENDKFNTQIAALLHDVGHCPFSHMGEVEMDSDEVRDSFIIELEDKDGITDELLNIIKDKTRKIGAIHEQISCIMILVHYYDKLNHLPKEHKNVKVNFDLIIRCILGITYNINATDENITELRTKNLCISLINDKAFDMDKLDYIMRDSLYTGIGTPRIDTKRLFRNLRITKEYKLVFMSKAVPALQNLIESRDSLYMWVYNHHSVIYSDFIYGYIFRRLGHNAEKINESEKIGAGIVPRNFIFSIDSIISQFYSDSDVQSILNVQNRLKMENLSGLLNDFPNETQENEFDDDIKRALLLVERLLQRKFLKPWWKTVFEFNNFMSRNFPDDSIRSQICKYVSHRGDLGLEPSEFRSQIAKHIIYLTEKMYEERIIDKKLSDGDFFIVQRSNRFFELETIDNFVIYLRKNEVINVLNDVVDVTDNYYGKYLTNLIPQKKYSDMYKSDGFYLYVQKFENNICDSNNNVSDFEINVKCKQKYYNLIEKSFSFIATELIRLGEIEFINQFQIDNKEKVRNNELSSKEKLWEKFKKEVVG